MNQQSKRRPPALQLCVCMLWALIVMMPANVIAQDEDIQLTESDDGSLTITWKNIPGASSYRVSYHGEEFDPDPPGWDTTSTSFTISGLDAASLYDIFVESDVGGNYYIRASTKGTLRPRRTSVPAPLFMKVKLPPPVTCPFLPPRVAVFGYAINTQCQMVNSDGIGRMDVIERGFIDAVDIWSYVNGGIEVCFRNSGSLIFLDAKYAPRLLTDLFAFERNGMTCGAIDGAGTVVLVNSGASAAPAPETAPAQPEPAQPEPAQPAAQPVTEAPPASDAIPLRDCLIKLVETLFLRAEPAGQIIGLVWLNSEVPAYEIQGYWYKIEFEGKTGYISRYHRKVLRGGCG